MVPKVQNQLKLSVIRAKLHWSIGLLGRSSQKSTRDLSQMNTEAPFPPISQRFRSRVKFWFPMWL